MEGAAKKTSAPFRGILGLAERIPQRDVRKLIWRHLTPYDREVVRCAHNARHTPMGWSFAVGAWQKACDYWSARGNVSLLEWAYTHGIDKYAFANASLYAADRGHLPVLEWLHEKALSFQLWTSCFAAKYGYIHILEWMQANGKAFDSNTVEQAIVGGQLECLQFLHLHGYANLYARTAVLAANYAYLSMLAAEGGHLDILKWMCDTFHSNGPTHIRWLLSGRINEHVARWLESLK